MSTAAAERAFRREYGAHRAEEGRRMPLSSLLELPYVRNGPHERQWRVRARSYDTFVARVLSPAARHAGRALRVLDLGAGNGWLSWRLARAGHDALALDVREDDVDGLGAASGFLATPGGKFARVAASFDALPVCAGRFDLVVFNASLHYALDLRRSLDEAVRATTAGGRVVVIDSPFYARDEDGDAMVAEKRRNAAASFGERAEALMALPFVEYLTAERLRAALPLRWIRHRVRYPLWYELRPLTARLRGARVPSRFDVWEASVA
ncbi:MAG: class I SAM-dependent methyltransferase [Gemmatimonadaceae bacterium]